MIVCQMGNCFITFIWNCLWSNNSKSLSLSLYNFFQTLLVIPGLTEKKKQIAFLQPWVVFLRKIVETMSQNTMYTYIKLPKNKENYLFFLQITLKTYFASFQLFKWPIMRIQEIKYLVLLFLWKFSFVKSYLGRGLKWICAHF